MCASMVGFCLPLVYSTIRVGFGLARKYYNWMKVMSTRFYKTAVLVTMVKSFTVQALRVKG